MTEVTPVRTGRLTSNERAEIERLAAKNLTAGQIAIRLNRHKSTVNFAMTVAGLRAPVSRKFDYKRNGKRVRSFSAEEDALIQALPATIGIRLKMLAAREESSDHLIMPSPGNR